MFNLKSQFSKHSINPKGVIHIGAHEGSEVAEYLNMGFNNILLIEANPKLISNLQLNFKDYDFINIAHAAITNFNGVVNLKITSFDQSSSILSLAKHKEIYPSIEQIDEISVPARTLDHLLFELGIDPSKYNFLSLDIQGAELLALMGSVSCLRHIDAVQTEISLIELYSNCALLPEIDEFMNSQGFGRSEIITPHHPSWGDAFYIRRSVISMSSLGSNGRFGNQLFQYLYLWSVARVQNAIIQVPQWIGNDLFSLENTPTCLSFPIIKEKAYHNIGEFSTDLTIDPNILLEHNPNLPNMDLWGYFQLHTSKYATNQDLIQDLFSFKPDLKNKLDNFIEKLKFDNKKIIAVHLRRGDYGYSSFYRAPCSWYENWLSNLNLNYEEYRVYVCSESANDYSSRFAGFDVVNFDFFGIVPDSSLSTLIDFYIMVNADILGISNSSFSFFASLLNKSAISFARPNITSQSMRTFDPWNSNVLDLHPLSANDHKLLELLD